MAVILNSFQTNPPIKLSKDPKQILGLMGASLLFIGVFTPIIRYPVIGTMNTFQHTQWEGPLILILAVISLFLSLTGRYNRLWFTGFLSLGVVAVTFITIQIKLVALQEKMAMRLAGNPFRGLADKAVQSVQIQWGWALLVAGALLLIASAALKAGLEWGPDRTK
jgi:amino acid transporter